MSTRINGSSGGSRISSRASRFRDLENRGVNRHLFLRPAETETETDLGGGGGGGDDHQQDEESEEAPDSDIDAERHRRNSGRGAAAAGAAAGSSSSAPLHVLLCTANLGNAAPDASSMAALLPSDGRVDDVVDCTDHPLPKKHTRGYGSALPSDLRDHATAAATAAAAAGTAAAGTFERVGPRGERRSGRSDARSSGGGDWTAGDWGSGGFGVEVRRSFASLFDEVGTTKEWNEESRGETFDLVVVAMQEATFRNGNGNGGSAGGAAVGAGGAGRQPPIPETAISTGETAATREGEQAGVDDGTKMLRDLIAARLGDEYRYVVEEQRGEMRLYILAREAIAEELLSSSPSQSQSPSPPLPPLPRIPTEATAPPPKVQVSAVITGIAAPVLSRKGGIAARLAIRGTAFVFLAVHLEAHEGPGRYAARLANLVDIFNRCPLMRAGADAGTPFAGSTATHVPHHVFCLGDLNFRVVLPGRWDGAAAGAGAGVGDRPRKGMASTGTAGAATSSRSMEDHRAEVRGMVYRKDWAGLGRADELSAAIRDLRKGCLANFRTLPCSFPPTFKVERGKGFHYKENRTPSYTDRIAWKSAKGMAYNVRPLVYEAVESFITSDHKPVRGAFAITR